MQARRIIVALLIIVVAVGGFIAGLVLLRERQDIREQAATPTGQARVSLRPETGSYNVGDTINSEVYFDTANIAISGIAVRISYPYSGSSPEVSVTGIDINPDIANDRFWNCPTKSSNLLGGNVVIEIACGNTSALGYRASGETRLATVRFNVTREPQTDPLIMRFDSSASRITQKSNNADILLIPTSTGSYTIGASSVASTSTPTPTIRSTGTVTVTVTTSPSPTKVATKTPTPTLEVGKGGERLPDAGVSYPTILGVGVGILIIAGALALGL